MSKVQFEILFFVLKNEVMHVFRSGLSKELSSKPVTKILTLNNSLSSGLLLQILGGREQQTTRQTGFVSLFLVSKTFCQT